MPTELDIKKEKEKAKELRKTRWWKQKKFGNPTCTYCFKPLLPEEVTMDHIVPLSRGGKTTKQNVTISCKACNNDKKNKLLHFEWNQQE